MIIANLILNVHGEYFLYAYPYEVFFGVTTIFDDTKNIKVIANSLSFILKSYYYRNIAGTD